MAYANLGECVADLERTGQLIRVSQPIDPNLEAAVLQRQVYRAQGPALLLENLTDCRFPALCNLFGTFERTRFLFRDTIGQVERLIAAKSDPGRFVKNPFRALGLIRPLFQMLPRSVRSGPILSNRCRISELPQIKSWPQDGGAFVTLPAVYTEHPARPGMLASNLGMYRVQLSGGEYADDEVGLHYQIHRGIGVHHTATIEAGVPFRVNVFVGGPPALMLAAVMPLPEGISELSFAGALGGRRAKMVHRPDGLPLFAEADFSISGTVIPDKLLPEGPFGDHLGYYSLVHDFPVLRVDAVYHRNGAIWPFTSVGRPPQEDTSFGHLIHELTGSAIPSVIAGLHEVHAVDASGVHPLLLAIGSERYTPYQQTPRPQELLTCAHAILGQGQMSLAKYLWIAARQDDEKLTARDVERFFIHMLQRVDWSNDLHFQTRTTIDTLDYSGDSLNMGSKLIIAAVGPPRRKLATKVPDNALPAGFANPRICLPGVVAVSAPPYRNSDQINALAELIPLEWNERIPLIIAVDDSEFVSRTLANFLWVTFTRSNPAGDVYGVGAFVEQKHWGCRGPLIIDARMKPHHAPPLEEDPEILKRVEGLAAPGGPLHGII